MGVHSKTTQPKAGGPEKSRIHFYRNAGESFYNDEITYLMARILLIINLLLVYGQMMPAQTSSAKEKTSSKVKKVSLPTKKTIDEASKDAAKLGKATPSPGPVLEGKRLALVIGNSLYGDKPLPRAIEDARTVEKALQTLGFQVTFKENSQLQELREVVTNFAGQAGANDIGFLYFSGLNAARDQKNYLLPAGQVATADWPASCPTLTTWLEILGKSAEGKFIVCLEAARQHPLLTALKAEQPGFAPVGKIPSNICLWLPTQPGKAAEWKYQGISLFTDTLTHNLVPGINHHVLFDRCKQDCAKACAAAPDAAQEPWMLDEIKAPILFKSALSTQFGQAEKFVGYEAFPMVGPPTASSEKAARVRQKVRETFAVALLFDKQRKTAWLPDAGDANAWVKAHFARDVTIKGFRVSNGCQKDVESFLSQAKVTQLVITTDEGEEEVNLAPRMGEVEVNLSKAHVTRNICFKINQVAIGDGEGELAKQVALSEIEFF